MKIKICGLFRDEDIDYVNEARPDYIGFVFTGSKRQVSAPLAQYLRFRLADDIVPVGVFINAPSDMITSLFNNGVISIAQLHGDEDESYITSLKRKCSANNSRTKFKVIKVIKAQALKNNIPATAADYILVDSSAGSGKTFDWEILNKINFTKPWFLAGGVSQKNINKAMALNPFAIDISSGAETDGVKDREKILQLISEARKG